MDIRQFFNKLKYSWYSLPQEGKKTQVVLYIITLGFFVGAAAGSVIAVFRYAKDSAFRYLLHWNEYSSHSFLALLLLFTILIIAALIVGRLIRNSAIRYGGVVWIDEALEEGQARPWFKILIPKFLGSWLVLALGISVGSEGPSIQMGAATALGMKNFDKKEAIERRYFILGGCAAGLAAAFSAPFSGICYVYEIMKEKLDSMLFIFLTSGAFGVYFSVVLVFELNVMLPLGPAPMPDLSMIWILALLGFFSGSAGLAYNLLLHLSLYLYKRQKMIPMQFRPLLPFLASGLMLLVFPAVSGEGLNIFANMGHPNWVVGFLSLFVIVKLVYTAFCYGSGIPAGLMVPIISIGGVMGGIYGNILIGMGLLSPEFATTMVILGMGGAFAAAERAPITAIVLVTEMTGASNTIYGMLLVAAISTLLARILKIQTS